MGAQHPVTQQRAVGVELVHVAPGIGILAGGALALPKDVGDQHRIAQRRDLLRIEEVGFLGAQDIGNQQDARHRASGGIVDHGDAFERAARTVMDDRLTGEDHESVSCG